MRKKKLLLKELAINIKDKPKHRVKSSNLRNENFTRDRKVSCSREDFVSH
jgi:hypothetical protein